MLGHLRFKRRIGRAGAMGIWLRIGLDRMFQGSHKLGWGSTSTSIQRMLIVGYDMPHKAPKPASSLPEVNLGVLLYALVRSRDDGGALWEVGAKLRPGGPWFHFV